MALVLKIIKNYWSAEETNIFKNYTDALAGFVVLVILPAIALISAVIEREYTFWNYTFPLLSISLAGLYDAYGRYEGPSPKNQKLVIRALFDFFAIFFSALCLGMENMILPYIAPGVLLLCGVLLCIEIFNRIIKAVCISPWSV